MDIADKMNKTKYNYIYRNYHPLEKINHSKNLIHSRKILLSKKYSFLKYSRNKRNKNRTK